MSVDLTVIGLGYVGLPLVQEAVRAGLSVRGFDINQGVVDALNAGRSHIDDISDEELGEILAGGFEASTDESVIEAADTVVICVPTPLSEDGGPDLGAVEGAVHGIARNLTPGTLVILEGVDLGERVYDIIFVVVTFSVLVQGTSIPFVAPLLGVRMRDADPGGVVRRVVAPGSSAEGRTLR